MSEPLDHVERPQPPWRDLHVSECGRTDIAHMVSRAEFYDRVKAQGQQRAAMSVCMTCWSTAQRWAGGYGSATRDETREQFLDPWRFDPAEVLSRDVHGERRTTLNRELRILTMLLEAHRDEFDEAMAGLDLATTMDDLRKQRAARSGKRPASGTRL